MTPPTDSLERLAAGTILASFTGPVVPVWLVHRIEQGLGGVCLFGSNLARPDAPETSGDEAATDVAAALHAVWPAALVTLDEEGGAVTRLEAATGSTFPGNAALGAIDDVDLTRRVAGALGSRLRACGIDLNLAPSADVNVDAANPVIGVRSFGADPARVGRHVAAFVSGLQTAGVAACVKHFPGHGATSVDSHLHLPVLDVSADELDRRELAPFRAAVAAGAATIMTGHLRVPALDPDRPATISRLILTDLLRGQLGFSGAVVTDALDMEGIGGPEAIPANVVRALAAGADLCCLGPDATDELVGACLDAVVGAVRSGALGEERLTEAAGRVAGIVRPGEPLTPATTNAASGRSPRSVGTDTDAALGAASPGDAVATAASAAELPASTPAAPGIGAAAGKTADPDLGRSAEVTSGTSGVGGAPSTAAAMSAGASDLHQCGPTNGAAIPSAPGLTGEPVDLGLDTARRAVRIDGALPASVRGAHVVELRRSPMIAAGAVPWGLAGPLAALDPTVTSERLADPVDLPAALDRSRGRPLVVVVRDPQSDHQTASLLAALVEARPDVTVVDMGWPADFAGILPAPRTRITTYGPSLASARAVARLLAGDLDNEPPPNPVSMMEKSTHG